MDDVQADMTGVIAATGNHLAVGLVALLYAKDVLSREDVGIIFGTAIRAVDDDPDDRVAVHTRRLLESLSARILAGTLH